MKRVYHYARHLHRFASRQLMFKNDSAGGFTRWAFHELPQDKQETWILLAAHILKYPICPF